MTGPWLTGLALLAGLLPATAQAIVNIEDMRSGAGAAGFAGNIEFSASGSRGNSEQLTLRSSARLDWRRNTSNDLLIADYSYGEAARLRNINKAFVHLRHGRRLTPRYTLEGFLQAGSDEFARIAFRGLVGGGLRIRLAADRSDRYVLGAGAFHEWENIEPQPGLSEQQQSRFWRGNLFLALRYAFSEHGRLVNTVYYQPRVAAAADLRLLDETVLLVALNDRLDLKLSLEISHDSRPPLDVEQTDISYTSGISFHF